MAELTLPEYIERLSGLTHETVIVNADQIANFIGKDKVANLLDFAFTVNTKMTGRRNRRTLIPKHKQVKKSRMARFDRKELLNELTAAYDQRSGTANPIPPGE